MNKRVKSKIKHIIVLLILLVTAFIGGRGMFPAFAATTEYSDVLADLQKDEEFNVADYPDNPKDYSLNVIQIAESAAGELLLYTYQPCQKTKYLVATDLKMSLNESAAGTKLYDLTLLNSSGVFCKYKVTDVKVSKAETRYYNITSIYRLWDKEIDKDEVSGNDINEVTYAVGKLFVVKDEGDSIRYYCNELSVIEIIPETKYIGYFRYFEGIGFIISYSEADCWYVGFDTNKPIDNLYEAELTFKSRVVEQTYIFNVQSGERFHEWQTIENLKLTGEDKGTAGNGIFGHRYEWDRIVSKDKFVTDPNYKLSEQEKENLKDCRWVLRFYETERTTTGDYKTKLVKSSQVSDVTILRLKFETAGKTYDLGVVDNKQSPKPDQRPGNSVNEKQGFFAYVWSCLVKLFTGKANIWETVVAVLALLVVVFVAVLAIKFIKFVVREIFK